MTAPSPSEELNELRDYVAVVRRRKWVIAVTVATLVGLTLVVSLLQTPIYEATADVLLQPRSSEEIFAPSDDRVVVGPPSARVETEIEVMKSRSVRQAVADELGQEPEVSINALGETEVVAISAQSTDPAEAARFANTYAETYIATRRQQLIDDLLAAGEQVQAKIDQIDQQLDDLQQPLAQIDSRIAEADGVPELQALQAERTRIEQDNAARRSALQAQRAAYSAQLDQLQLARNLTRTGGAQQVSRAVEPTSPVRPTPVLNAVLALMVGLMLGVGLAFVRERLDDTIKTKDDLERAAGGLTVLGLIPAVPSWKDRSVPLLVSANEPNSAAAEAYRTLRTSVQFIGVERPVKVIQLTSPAPGEGKTTTLANLGVALANAGQRVVVVCCDLRRPRVHEYFGLGNTVGFTSVLLGEVPLAAALQATSVEGRLALLASGPPPPNPSELLASGRSGEVLAALKAQCDIVLVDAPPVLPVTDSIVLSGMVDATILVATAKRSTRKEVHRSVELLRQHSAPLVGAVLNGADPEATYGYGYGYSRLDEDGPADAAAPAVTAHPSNGARRQPQLAEPAPAAAHGEATKGPAGVA